MSDVPEGPLGAKPPDDYDYHEPWLSDWARRSLFRTTNGMQGWQGAQGPQGAPR